MFAIEEFIKQNVVLIIAIMSGLILIMFFMIIALKFNVNKMQKKHKRLLRGVNSANLEEVIDNYYDKIEYQIQENDLIRENIKTLNMKLKSTTSKISLKRYRAFEDVGSDLSFSLAILDENKNGVVITSLYSRSESTVYGKTIENGKSTYELSQEEKDVIEEAIKRG
ncbi:DUF4446 family protein [Clostridium sediminicola]|uniref:DUF4446 family protein n=1 Tax=Clostridium sediminicola TaxID=3114879 RepID=UPI0031F1F9B9